MLDIRKQAVATISAVLYIAIPPDITGYKLCDPAENCYKEEFKPIDINDYYSSTTDLYSQALKSELNAIIQNHRSYSYTPCVWKALEEIDQDPENPNNVIALYTQRSIPKLRRDCGNGDDDAWNREHIWSKSHGFPNKNQDAYTDIHNLVPADKSVNSDRSDFDFKVGGEPNSECTKCKEGDDTWEPPDLSKGQIARMMFYMDVRYEGNDNSNTPDLELVDRSTVSKEPAFGYLSNLLEWHCQYPVSDVERRRNDKVYSWQGNRNPFIDHPEFVNSIWDYECPVRCDVGDDCTKSELEVVQADLKQLQIGMKEMQAYVNETNALFAKLSVLFANDQPWSTRNRAD
eukprot:CAMPEP_0194357818 /NCGR_PEP_ID=MMETSP0174-20130528/5245_1 /TAXON_ID=216777 /ORGANISM="Proboscia alata, Strain PI-D3" /LENGTH=344 /DNA_ID=CAMNT_0039127997 /DNA_START=46 /DNA_END=1080 /DNA_ORIENTATION=+